MMALPSPMRPAHVDRSGFIWGCMISIPSIPSYLDIAARHFLERMPIDAFARGSPLVSGLRHQCDRFRIE